MDPIVAASAVAPSSGRASAAAAMVGLSCRARNGGRASAAEHGGERRRFVEPSSGTACGGLGHPTSPFVRRPRSPCRMHRRLAPAFRGCRTPSLPAATPPFARGCAHPYRVPPCTHPRNARAEIATVDRTSSASRAERIQGGTHDDHHQRHHRSDHQPHDRHRPTSARSTTTPCRACRGWPSTSAGTRTQRRRHARPSDRSTVPVQVDHAGRRRRPPASTPNPRPAHPLRDLRGRGVGRRNRPARRPARLAGRLRRRHRRRAPRRGVDLTARTVTAARDHRRDRPAVVGAARATSTSTTCTSPSPTPAPATRTRSR